jgi:predicted phosphate transport protein (TIGR00153 family)
MLGWFYRIMPKEERFFDMFERHVQCIVGGSSALRGMLDGGPRVKEFCEKIAAHEHEADLITEEVFQAIRRSFITPFDRGDIRGLITSMDDAIDQMNKTAKAVLLFEVDKFDDPMRHTGDLIIKSAALAAEAIPLLRTMRANAPRLNVLTGEIVRIEEETDQLCLDGLKALLAGPAKNDAMVYIKGAEIYDHLEKVADCFQDVANRISGLVIEHL